MYVITNEKDWDILERLHDVPQSVAEQSEERVI